MNEGTVRSILRIIAVVAMLIGVTQFVSAIAAVAIAGPRALTGPEIFLFAPPLVILAEGFLLFAVSPAVARRVVQP